MGVVVCDNWSLPVQNHLWDGCNYLYLLAIKALTEFELHRSSCDLMTVVVKV